ncbi:MAG: histidine phosphatase family protein [Cyanobacteria bacterium P01_D01_bin.71]
MLKLLFMRHGESTSNRDRRLTGQDDSPLTAQGHQQCRQLATWLHAQSWPPTHIYSSPLRRALESLDDVMQPWPWPLVPPVKQAQERWESDRAGLDQRPLPGDSSPAAPQFQVCPLLREFDAGILTGLTWPEAQQRYPDLCHQLETSADWVPIPAAETPQQGRQRAQAFLNDLLHRHCSGDAIWILSHHWILEHLIACLLGCDRTWQIAMANTALFEFWLDRDRWEQAGMPRSISDLWQIKQFNSTPHLAGVNSSD